jgi:hypothetical protein
MRKLIASLGVAAAMLLSGPASAASDELPDTPSTTTEVGGGSDPLGIAVIAANPDNPQDADAPAGPAVSYPVPAPMPVQTNENGVPVLLSQDNGDGEHASILMVNALRDGIEGRSPSLGDVSGWHFADYGETNDSNDSQTVFEFTANGTRFRVVLQKVAE